MKTKKRRQPDTSLEHPRTEDVRGDEFQDETGRTDRWTGEQLGESFGGYVEPEFYSGVEDDPYHGVEDDPYHGVEDDPYHRERTARG